MGGVRSISGASNTQVTELRNQLGEMQQHCETLEKERDFYFDSASRILNCGVMCADDIC